MQIVITKICNLLTVLFISLTILVGGVMAIPILTGKGVYAVQSGSMEPTYHVGSIVVVDKRFPVEMLKEKDPVTFYTESGAVATHRIQKVDSENSLFQTKGDANEEADTAAVLKEQIIGKVEYSVPYVGYIPLYMRTAKGIFAISAYISFFILLQLFPMLLKGEEDEKDME